ncbi:hypothetical protein ACSQ67_007857 [Phaseolus vulgaris]
MKPLVDKCLKIEDEELEALWHKRYGHLNSKSIQIMQQKQMVEGLPKLKEVFKVCTDVLTWGDDENIGAEELEGGETDGEEDSHEEANDEAVDPARAANKGSKKRVVNSLPKFTYVANKIGECGRSARSARRSLLTATRFACRRRCGHRFHVAWVDTWLSLHSSCPSAACFSPSPADEVRALPAVAAKIAELDAKRKAVQ